MYEFARHIASSLRSQRTLKSDYRALAQIASIVCAPQWKVTRRPSLWTCKPWWYMVWHETSRNLLLPCCTARASRWAELDLDESWSLGLWASVGHCFSSTCSTCLGFESFVEAGALLNDLNLAMAAAALLSICAKASCKPAKPFWQILIVILQDSPEKALIHQNQNLTAVMWQHEYFKKFVEQSMCLWRCMEIIRLKVHHIEHSAIAGQQGLRGWLLVDPGDFGCDSMYLHNSWRTCVVLCRFHASNWLCKCLSSSVQFWLVIGLIYLQSNLVSQIESAPEQRGALVIWSWIPDISCKFCSWCRMELSCW